jgi:hypothetical protein
VNQTRPIRMIALLAALSAALAVCATPQVEPGFSRLGETLELDYGAITRVGTEGLLIAFREVPHDSRCPSNVQCVWSGDAIVRLEARMPDGVWSPLDLHTHVAPFEAEFGDYVIELHGLMPYPREGLPMRVRDYRAALRVRAR